MWTTRRRITVPMENVRGARIDPDVVRHGPWLGAGYTDALLDSTLAAGPMVVRGRHEFRDVHFPERTIVVDLVDEQYERLVIDVDDPEAAVAEINAAVGARPRRGDLEQDGPAPHGAGLGKARSPVAQTRSTVASHAWRVLPSRFSMPAASIETTRKGGRSNAASGARVT